MVKTVIICDECKKDCEGSYLILEIVNHCTFTETAKHICFDCARKGVRFDVDD